MLGRLRLLRGKFYRERKSVTRERERERERERDYVGQCWTRLPDQNMEVVTASGVDDVIKSVQQLAIDEEIKMRETHLLSLVKVNVICRSKTFKDEFIFKHECDMLCLSE